MKIAFVLILAGMFFTGCMQIGPVKLPMASTNFTAKVTYSVTSDKMWEAITTALDKNRIATTSADRASGILQTDYVEGASSLIAGGLVASQSTRYKFNLTVRSQSEGKVRLNIISKVESTMHGRAGVSQWTDVSGQNAVLTKNLENWLYEEIEKNL